MIARVKCNYNAIRNFLDSDIDVASASPQAVHHLSTFEIDDANTAIHPVMFTLFYIEGKVILGHYMLRSDKTNQWLPQAAQKFLVIHFYSSIIFI